MLSCETCDYLRDNHGNGNYCSVIPNGYENKDKPFYITDSSLLIINNPYKFGCLLHSKLEDYYKRITREELIPNDPRIRE